MHKSLGYAKAIIDNGDTLDFPYVVKSEYIEGNENKRRGNYYIAFRSIKDTFASSQQIGFAISKSQRLDFLSYVKPINSNAGSGYAIYNKDYIQIDFQGELKFELENNDKDSMTFIANGHIPSLNINYAFLRFNKND